MSPLKGERHIGVPNWTASKRSGRTNGYQVRGISHSGQKKESAESLRSKFQQLILKKGHVLSESRFKKKKKIDLLQRIFPSKCKESEGPLQKGKPETATAQSQEAVQSTSTMDSRAIEAQTLMLDRS